MGSPVFAVKALDAVALHHDVLCCFTNPPSAIGRKKIITPTAVHLGCRRLGIDVYVNLDMELIRELQPDAIVVVAYGSIISQEILDIPKYGCFNIHPSLLPRWRGASPIQSAILHDDKKTGVCIIQMDAGLDTGNIILSTETEIQDDDTYQSLHDSLSTMGADLLLNVLNDIENIVPLKQQGDMTYAKKVEKTWINWRDDARAIWNQVRALSPDPGVFFCVDGMSLKLISVNLDEGVSEISGKILNKNMHISCGSGAIMPKVIQRIGRNPVSVNEFMCGHRGIVGKSCD